MADNETPIKPLYSTTRANQPVLLGRTTLHITCEGHQFTCPGEASLHLQPRLRLTLNADFSGEPAMSLCLGTAVGPITLQYGRHARPVNVLMVNSALHSGPGGSTATSPARPLIPQQPTFWTRLGMSQVDPNRSFGQPSFAQAFFETCRFRRVPVGQTVHVLLDRKVGVDP